MQITNFKDMYLAELQEQVSMEGQLADELPRMAEAASHPSLKNILMHHRDRQISCSAVHVQVSA
jgi:ferritin-like metal-binding protein YciE